MKKKKDPRVALGQRGEALAEARLCRAGYRILERNYHARRAELDLIATLGGGVIFVEVRSQTGSYLESPALTVNKAKRHRVVTAARAWMAARGMRNWDVRFDVIAVRFRGEEAELEWIEDAFRPPDTSRKPRYY